MFEIKYSDLAGRIGILHTNHGKIETPSFVPVIHPVKQSIPAKKIKEIGFDVVITNGSEISEDTLNELKILNQKRGLILFLDPDYQGERIRRLINDYVGETKHAFLSKKELAKLITIDLPYKFPGWSSLLL